MCTTYTHTQIHEWGFQVEKEENYEFLLSFIPLFPGTPTAKECQVGHGSVARESKTKAMLYDPDLSEGALASLAKPYGLVSHGATKKEVEEHVTVHDLELTRCLHLQGLGPHRSQSPAGFELVRAKTGKAE